MMWGNYGMTTWGWGFGGLVLVGVIVLVIVAVRMSVGKGRPTPPTGTTTTTHGDAARILNERYARGELTTEEYQERKEALRLKNE